MICPQKLNRLKGTYNGMRLVLKNYSGLIGHIDVTTCESSNNNIHETLTVGNQQFEIIKKYTYLGTLVTENNYYTTEIKVKSQN